MIIRDWDIWHAYSSFLETDHVDLVAAGEALVRAGLAACVLHRDGYTWWQTNDGIRSGQTHIELDSRKNGAKIVLEVDGGGDDGLVGYAAEAWYQASHFRFNEIRLCSDGPIPPPYIRAVLGEFHLSSSEPDFGIILYPVVKLFESGVVLVQFRTIAPKRDIPIEEFIDRHVNLASVHFDEVKVPPAVSNLAAKAYHQSIIKWPIHLRYFLSKAERGHRQAVAEKTQEIRSGDFTAQLAPLHREDKEGETLASLAKTIYSIIGFVISNPRSGTAFLLRGQKRIIRAGNYWCGRPHIYLIDFDGQKASAGENVQTYGGEFGWIHGRYPSGSQEAGLRYLPADMRHFDDYSAFISQSASLWVWSTQGKERQAEVADANRGHLIYEQQATVELLEYGHMLHRALLAKVEAASNSTEVHELRWAVNHLRSDIADATHFGEIRDLLHAGWNELGITNLQSRIDEGLSIRSDQTALREAHGSERVGRWLTIVFGVVATPPLANDVLRPLWKLLEWWSPSNASAESLFFISIAVIFVIALIASLSGIEWRRQK